MCWYAQRTMATSRRIGIDEDNPAEPVMDGSFHFIRNPTCSGPAALTMGFWLIWPTWPVLTVAGLFWTTLELQVRCEEEFLLLQHGQTYAAYSTRTKRYVPGIY